MNLKDLLKDAYKEGMTVEEIDKALAHVTLNDGSDEIEKLKTALSKANSEASDYKKQLREKMTADEIKAKEDIEKQEKLQNDYNALLKRVAISDNKANLLALGYEDKLAQETAEAIVNNDLTKVFANQKLHQEAIEKKIRTEVLQGTPKPNGGSTGNPSITKEQFDKMEYADRVKLFNEQPDVYKQFTEGE